MSTSLYRKNIRQWEQWSRVVAGIVMVAAAVALATPVASAALVVGGAFMIVTGFVGWCPACAAVGRRLESGARDAGQSVVVSGIAPGVDGAAR